MDLRGESDEPIVTAVNSLAAAFGRKLSPEGLNVWVKRLRPYRGAKLWAAIEKATESRSMPSIGEVLELMPRRDRQAAWEPPPPLSAQERRRVDNAAIMSMLHLHYTMGWPLEDFSWHAMGRAFGKHDGTPATDIPKILQHAKEHYTQARVEEWMRVKYAELDRLDAAANV